MKNYKSLMLYLYVWCKRSFTNWGWRKKALKRALFDAEQAEKLLTEFISEHEYWTAEQAGSYLRVTLNHVVEVKWELWDALNLHQEGCFGICKDCDKEDA